MQFKKGANVYDVNGEKIGDIDRVVIDPSSGSVTHLVVQKGFWFKEDKVIPVDQVLRTTDDAVHLNLAVGHLKEMPDFLETNYLPMDEQEIARGGYSAADAHPVYWYPAVGAMPIAWSGGYWGMYPPVEEESHGYKVIEEENIPEGTVALKEGSKVLGKDGKHVGDIEKILTENQKDQVTHLVVTKGLFGQQKKLIPANWVRQIREDAVQLSVGSELVDRLRDYDE